MENIQWDLAGSNNRKQLSLQKRNTGPLLGSAVSLLVHCLEAEVGIGLKMPQSRDKITRFYALLKTYRPLLVHSLPLLVDARFDARAKASRGLAEKKSSTK